MKTRLTFLLISLCAIFTIRCSEEQEVKQAPAPQTVALKFDVNGVEKIVNATAIYDQSLKRVRLVSTEIEETEAVHDVTKKSHLRVTLKASHDYGRTELVPGGGEIKTGYYGYSEGCFYYGTLIAS